MNIAPDLCVEFLSTSSLSIDRRDKFDLYARHGVSCYWIIDPGAHTFEAFILEGKRCRLVTTAANDDAVVAPPFEELTIPLGDLWLRHA